MSQTAIIYKSKHGYTQKIAEYLSKQLNADLFSTKEIKKLDTSNYDSFIFGCSIYCGMMGGKKELSKLYPEIKDKKIALFTVGMTEINDKEYYKKLIDLNIKNSEVKNTVKIYHFLGGLDYNSLGFISKKMMGMITKQIEGKENKSEHDKEMLKMKTEKIDFSAENSYTSLIEYIKA